MISEILQDALFAAIAAIGFAAISRPPHRAYLYCAIIAAAGHSLRFWLMNATYGYGMHIVVATLIATFAIGLLAVFLSPVAHMPAETSLFPSLPTHDSGHLRLQNLRRHCDVPALRLAAGLRPLFLSILLQRHHLHGHTALHGHRRHNTDISLRKIAFQATRHHNNT